MYKLYSKTWVAKAINVIFQWTNLHFVKRRKLKAIKASKKILPLIDGREIDDTQAAA